MPFLQQGPKDQLRLHIYIQPKATRNQVVGLHGQELKVAITAPPVDGQANKALITFLAKALGIAKSKISLARGQQSRHKLLFLTGISAAEARQRLGG